MGNYNKKTKKAFTYEDAFEIFNMIKCGIVIIAIALICLFCL